MRLGQFALVTSIFLALTFPALAATRTHRSHTVSRKSVKHPSTKSKSKKVVGQRSIDDQRATEIQTALIKAGYLAGEPTGHWDGASETAMQKLQADNGWQTKLVPDSRAIIKLGLGPVTVTPASSARDAGTTSGSLTQSLQ